MTLIIINDFCFIFCEKKRMFHILCSKNLYKLTDLEKTEEFGGGGSGGGAEDTSITESIQCYYNALI